MIENFSRREIAALLAGTALAMATQPLQADDAISADARKAVTQMGQTLSTGAYSFTAQTIREYEKNDRALHIFHDLDVTVRRPDRLKIDITGDDGQAQIGYDGKTLIIYTPKANKYATMDASGTLETMLRAASERLGMDFPLADLLAENPGKAFLDGVSAGSNVGDATIGGTPSNHFYFSQPPDLDIELWTEDQRAVPRRIVVTYRSLPNQPQFIAEMSKWQFGINPPDSEFVIKVPEGATKFEGRQKQ